ncbi:MAG: hypothetical protein IPM32_13185 [Ignavibacteriae bacterium]|nr:hypothetical protein [Ignavibacteriota bacterium]
MTTYLKIINFVLLLIYSTYVFRTALPLLDYLINYTFIITELCEQKDNLDNMCMGKCHLQKEMKKQVDTESKQKQFVILEKFKIDHISFSQHQNRLNPTFINFIKIDCTFSNFLNIEPLSPPPKFSSFS